MNKDAQDAEIAHAFKSLQPAKRTRGCLVAKARRLSKAFHEAGRILAAATEPDTVSAGGVEHAASAFSVPGDLPCAEEVTELVNDIHQASADIRSFELDLEQMR